MAKRPRRKFALLVTEDELSNWSRAYEWTLPRARTVFTAEELAGENTTAVITFTDFNPRIPISDRSEDWMLAEFTSPARSPTAGRSKIPFYRVQRLLGFSEPHVGILRGRYASFGVEFALAAKPVCEAFATWWQTQRVNMVMRDVEDGMRALVEIVGGVGCGADSDSKACAIACASVRRTAIGSAGEGVQTGAREFLDDLFCYSRERVFNYAPVVSALCDLGTIMRTRTAGLPAESEARTRFSGFLACVSALVKSSDGEPFKSAYGLCVDLAKTDSCYQFENVVFLAWKFAAEQKGGAVDFKQILDDVAQMRRAAIPEDAISGAVCLFGGYAGFASFATQYHQWRREKGVTRK